MVVTSFLLSRRGGEKTNNPIRKGPVISRSLVKEVGGEMVKRMSKLRRGKRATQKHLYAADTRKGGGGGGGFGLKLKTTRPTSPDARQGAKERRGRLARAKNTLRHPSKNARGEGKKPKIA